MKRSLLAALALIGFGIPVESGYAEGLIARPVIAGTPMSCSDFRGATVRTLRTTELGDVASARVMGRIPVILIDTNRLGRLPGKLQLFFYGHECAHHVLGHSYAATTSSENEADCWSIKSGRDKGLFTRGDVESWAPYFSHSRGSRVGHLPGPQRAKRLVTCFDDRTDELIEPQASQEPPVFSTSAGG